MYEHKRKPVIPARLFVIRVFSHLLRVLTVVGVALAAGVLGYRFLGGLSWIDSLYEASMILGGMGPSYPLPSTAAKVFASCYALFAGLAVIAIAGFMLAPFFHRMLHHFHWEEDEGNR